ncbi:CapA family protein [Paenibacillus thalictri]|uniref:CapA family protein n=1 Tax=Paenibacillus thalictri TaxID=2527873 RepID=A0A4Q9DDX1_9BACL|nr:CapA family protein [Paenibacillus thalictri]TBL69385.1 CapA family protein [Paenibacillus thalictri]
MLQQPFLFAAAGQSLIKKDMREHMSAVDCKEIISMLQAADLSFTNFEGTIQGSYGGWPTKTSAFAASSPSVLDTLQAFGFNMLSLCNNHSFDLGPGGILSTLEEMHKHPFLHAGIGVNMAEASRVRHKSFGKGRVALAAIDFGPQAEYVYAFDGNGAIPSRPGNNRQLIAMSSGRPLPDAQDMQRHLDGIRKASGQADFVAVYAHSHHWEQEMEMTPDWMQAYAHSCIDAGANIFICHGTPVLQGMEVYKERPIFYGLGNFIFHTYQPARWLERTGTKAWESVIVQCRFHADGNLLGITCLPIAVGGLPAEAADAAYSYSAPPRLMSGSAAERTLERFSALSAKFGVQVEPIDGKAEVRWS